MKKNFYFTLVIFFLALILRFFAILDMGIVPYGDSESYNLLACSIVERGEFAHEPGKSISWRPPLYPLFLAVLYILGGHNYFFVGIVQSVIGAWVCIFIYWIARQVFNEAVGLIAGLISACYMYFVAPTKFLMTEVLFIFLFTVSMYYLIHGLKRDSVKNMVICGFLLGLATLTRPITFLFPLFIFVFISLTYKNNRRKLKMLPKLFISMLIMFLMPISIWTARNYIVHKAFVPVSTNGGMNFFIGNTPDENGRYRIRSLLEKEALEIEGKQQPKSEIERNEIYFKKALEYIIKHPNVVARLMVMKFAFFWSPFDWFFFGPKGTYNYHYGFILPFALAAMFSLIRKWREYWLLYLPVIYIMGIALIFHVEPRYRMPIEPFLIIFSSYGIFFLFQRYLNKWIPVFITIGLFAINFLAYLSSDMIKEGGRYIFQSMGLW